jgi:drug/metabolite transporter (DMT)-like permease
MYAETYKIVRRKDHIDLNGAGLLVLCSILVGINQVFIKIVNGGLQPVFQAGFRSICAFLPVLIFAMVMKKPLSIRDGSFWPGILAGVLFSTEFMLLFVSLDYIDVSRASVLFYTMPFWTALGAHYFIPGDQLTPPRVVGLLLAILGVFVALSSNKWSVDSKSLMGDLFCLIGAMLWASIVLMARATRFSRACPEMQLLYQLGVSAILLTALSPLFGDLIREINGVVLILFVIQVLVVVSFGFLTWFWLLSVYPASRMASYSFLSPVFGVFFGWLILGEKLTENIVVALTLVSVGVYLVSKRPGPTRQGLT